MRKKLGLGMLLLTALMFLSGCGEKQVPIEDYVRSNPTTDVINGIMKSDTGYYYCAANRRPLSMHYYDEKSDQNIFLCSKPECRHDGDAFCTATSEKYTVRGACYYGDALYLNVVEKTDTEYLCKLIQVSEDGTELTELVTYQSVNNTSLWVTSGEPMIIHRGVVVLPYVFRNTDDDNFCLGGICLYDLISGEQKLLPEMETNQRNKGYSRLSACGDYIYYNMHQNARYTLSRYCLTDGTIEALELSGVTTGMYNGMYEVMDENTIYYCCSGNSLYEYQISDNTSKEHTNFFKEMVYQGGGKNGCADMMTDGTYFYVGEGVYFRDTDTGYMGVYVDSDGVETPVKSYVHVFDRELNEVAKVEIATEYYMDDEVSFSIAILDGMVYLQTWQTVFQCTLEEFLANEVPPFTPVYDHVDIEF